MKPYVPYGLFIRSRNVNECPCYLLAPANPVFAGSTGYNVVHDVTGLPTLLTPVAQGDFPRGFTLSGDIPEDYRTPCRMAIPHKAAQRLLGGSEIIDVIGVKNTTDSTYMVREEMCLSDDVIAVALFKKSYLAPGEEMELYILRDKLYYENVQRKARRPRVTWGDE